MYTDADYDVFIDWLAQTPRPGDTLLVFRCLLRDEFHDVEFDEMLRRIQRLSGVDPAIANTALTAMKENGLFVVTSDRDGRTAVISYVTDRLLLAKPPGDEERQAIAKAVEGKERTNLKELSEATGIGLERLRELKGFLYAERFLNIYVGSKTIPTALSDEEAGDGVQAEVAK